MFKLRLCIFGGSATRPDHDAPGVKAALAIQEILKDQAHSIRAIELPESLLPKWDLADPLPEGFTLSHLKALVGKDVALRKEQRIDSNEAFILDYKNLCQKVREDFKILQESIKTEGFNDTTLQRLEAWWKGCEKADNQTLDIYNAQDRYQPYLERHHITLEPEKEPLRRIQRHLGYERYDWSPVHQYQFLCKEVEFLNKDPNEDFGSAILLIRRQATAYQLYKDPSLLEEARARGLAESLEVDRKAFLLYQEKEMTKDIQRNLLQQYQATEKAMKNIGPVYRMSDEELKRYNSLYKHSRALAYEIAQRPDLMTQARELGLEDIIKDEALSYSYERRPLREVTPSREITIDPQRNLLQQYQETEKAIKDIGPVYYMSDEELKRYNSLYKHTLALAHSISQSPDLMSQAKALDLEDLIKSKAFEHTREKAKQRDRDHGWEY